MRSLFEQLIQEGEAGIERLIAERTQETVELDFKLKSDPAHGRFENDDKKNLAQELSAFANSAGGLIVWGVNADKGPDGVDCAQAPPEPIAEIERFRSEAIRLSGQLLAPHHDGIAIEKIDSLKEPGKGYLLVHVERSERRPHMSLNTKDRRYYKRGGDSAFVMEHYDVEDAFRRMSVAALMLELRYSRRPNMDERGLIRGSIDLCLRNTSRISAKQLYLQTRGLKGADPAADNRIYRDQQLQDDWVSYDHRRTPVLHPGMSCTMCQFGIEFQDDMGRIQGVNSLLWAFFADCRFGCEDLPVIEKTIKIDRDWLQHLVEGGPAIVVA